VRWTYSRCTVRVTASHQITATFELSFGDLLRAQLWHLRRQRGILFLCGISTFALLTTVIPAIISGRERASDPRFIGVFGTAFVLFPLASWWQARKAFRSLKSQQLHKTYVFEFEGLTFSDGLSSAHLLGGDPASCGEPRHLVRIRATASLSFHSQACLFEHRGCSSDPQATGGDTGVQSEGGYVNAAPKQQQDQPRTPYLLFPRQHAQGKTQPGDPSGVKGDGARARAGACVGALH
jgi:hypothetical protein